MNIIAHIIDTDTIEPGDFVAFTQDGQEVAGIAKGFNDDGEIDVALAGRGTVSVAHEAVTDIM